MGDGNPGASRPGGLRRDATSLLSARLGAVALRFFAGVVTARLLEPAIRGEYGMLATMVPTIAVVANLGFPESVVYFYNRGEANAARIATSILAVSVCVGLVCLGVGALAVPWLAERYFPVGGTTVAWLAIGSSAMAVVHRNSLASLFAARSFGRASLYLIVQPALFALGMVVLYLASSDLRAVALCFFAAWLIGALLPATPLVAQFDPRSLSRDYLKRVAGFSSRSYGNAIAGQLNYRLDIFVIAYFVDDLAVVAYYHIAASLTSFIWLLPDAIGQTLYPQLAGLRDERERARRTVSGLRHALLLSVAAALPLAALCPWLVPLLFGSAYTFVVVAVYLLLPGVVAMSVAKVLMRFLLSRNRHGLAALASALGVGLDMLLIALLVPRYGLVGASVAASAAYLLATFLFVFAFLRLSERTGDEWRAFPRREIESYLALARSRLQRLAGR